MEILWRCVSSAHQGPNNCLARRWRSVDGRTATFLADEDMNCRCLHASATIALIRYRLVSSGADLSLASQH